MPPALPVYQEGVDERQKSEKHQHHIDVEWVILEGPFAEGEDGELEQRHDSRQGHHQPKKLPKVLGREREGEEGSVAPVEEGAADHLQDEGDVLQGEDGD